MALKIETGEDTVMNMTPMIDIVFQLVVFFMLTLDMTNKEYAPLTLPFANQGIEDKEHVSHQVMPPDRSFPLVPKSNSPAMAKLIRAPST